MFHTVNGFKDHYASTRPRSGSEQRVLCCVTVREQRNVCSLRAVWSSRATTLNPDRGSVSSESVFSARVESPSDPQCCVVYHLHLFVAFHHKVHFPKVI